MTEVITADRIADRTVPPKDFRNAYRNNSTVWIMATRGMIPLRVHVSLRNLCWLPNTARGHVEMENMEVAKAYQQGVEMAIGDKQTERMPWIWTYEEDNVQPRDVFFKLFDAIWTCIDCGEAMPSDPVTGNPAEPWVCPNGHKGLDAVAGLYRTKSEPSMPMAFGNPRDPVLEFRPLDVTEAEREGRVIEVNGFAMGCTLFRKNLFEKISKPWFRTVNGSESDLSFHTQDLYFCRKAKEEIGARFAVHCGVSVGHMDVKSGEIY